MGGCRWVSYPSCGCFLVQRLGELRRFPETVPPWVALLAALLLLARYAKEQGLLGFLGLREQAPLYLSRQSLRSCHPEQSLP